VTAAPARTRVVVADDHPVFREGLARAIRERPDLELVAEADDGRAALGAIAAREPHVAILDVKMPELGGTEVVEALVRDGSSVRVILLSAFHDSATVFRALEAGAAAYLTKDASRAAICDGRGRHGARGDRALPRGPARGRQGGAAASPGPAPGAERARARDPRAHRRGPVGA